MIKDLIQGDHSYHKQELFTMPKKRVRVQCKSQCEIASDTISSDAEIENTAGSHKKPVKTRRDYLGLFLQSRKVMEVTMGTLKFYTVKLGRFLRDIDVDSAKVQDIERFLLQFVNSGNRHAYFRVAKTFFNWRELTFGLPNPMKNMRAPRLPKLILPSLEREQVFVLIDNSEKVRDKAIIALFVESGLREIELANIKLHDINWKTKTIKVLGKGQKEALATFGTLTEKYLKEWLSQYDPKGGNIWGLTRWGIVSMLNRLEVETGIKCNPHVFRRTFAYLLRKAGIDCMTIMDLGRWESVEMVQRYTRSVNFNDSLKFYKGPLS